MLQILEEADQTLKKKRDEAITEFGNLLLRLGYNVDDMAFRVRILRRARELEEWREAAMARARQIADASLAPVDPGALLN